MSGLVTRGSSRRLNKRRGGAPSRTRGGFANPYRIHEYAHGTVETVPDIVEFIVSDRYLNRPNIYPRQMTFQKIIFLQDELFTQFDYDVIGEWEETFLATGNEGISPGILDRIRINKAQGRKWFRETQAVWGRRGSKGFNGGICGAHVLWNYMHLPGGPQNFYGIDRDKRITGVVFAGKKEQARANQWQDIINVVTGAPCFAPYISRHQAERLTIFAPTDILRQQRMEMLGHDTDADLASFEIIPAPSTTMAARGPTSFMQFYDEQAHVLNSTANADAEAVYQCLDPSTRVLTADLIWRPISEIEVGDRLVAMDEHSDGRTGSPRKMREAVVLGKGGSTKEAFRITFEDGTSVVSSALHRWMRASPGAKDFKWATIEIPPVRTSNSWSRLKVGDRIRSLVDQPWEVEDSREAGYLAGLFDGEGYVRFSERGSMRVTFTQKPGLVLDETLRLLRERGYDPRVRSDTPSGCTELIIEGLAECWRLLGEINPLRLRENARHLWQGRSAGFAGGAKVITSIESVGVMDLVDIETSTKTFVAEGLISHNSAVPSLDQFKKDGFIYAPSSPWAKTGQFFTNWELAIEMNPDGTPAYPERVMLQLPSWGPYEDWEEAQRIPLRPPKKTVIEVEVEVKKRKKVNGKAKTITVLETQEVERLIPDELGNFKRLKGAIQAFDDDMRQLERANPETFAVERRSHWAESLSAYLNAKKVAEIFKPWSHDPDSIFVNTQGTLAQTYSGHGDPATSNKRFGWSIAHRVWVPDADPEKAKAGEGMYHVVFDRIRCWEPGDYEDHLLDYDDVMGDIWTDVKNFLPEDVSFDQYNVPATIGTLRKKLSKAQLPKSVRVREVSRTRQLNWRHYELFKSAINMGLVHAPMYLREQEEDGGWKVNYASSEVENELKFLEEKNGAVDHPTTGPVQTKDIADTMCEVVVQLIGKELATFLGQELDGLGVSGGAPQGTDPGRHTRTSNETFDRLGNVTGGAATRGMGQASPSRGMGMRRR